MTIVACFAARHSKLWNTSSSTVILVLLLVLAWQVGIMWPSNMDILQLIHSARVAWTKPMFMEMFVVAAYNIWKERKQQTVSRD